MKFALVLALILSLFVPASAAVRSGSLHRSDAQSFSNGLLAVGVISDVSIMRNAGGTHFVAYFPVNYSVEDEIFSALIVALTAGEVSRRTSWTSSLAIAVYRNTVVGVPTSVCRELVRMVNAGYSDTLVIAYYLQNSYTLPRSESAF